MRRFFLKKTAALAVLLAAALAVFPAFAEVDITCLLYTSRCV